MRRRFHTERRRRSILWSFYHDGWMLRVGKWGCCLVQERLFCLQTEPMVQICMLDSKIEVENLVMLSWMHSSTANDIPPDQVLDERFPEQRDLIKKI